MDKLANDMTVLLRELLASHQRLLQIATIRQDAMRAFDVDRLNSLLEREKAETDRLTMIEKLRKVLVEQLKIKLGKSVEPTISEFAKRLPEPRRTELLGLAGQLRSTIEQLDRYNRINSKVSESVVKSFAKILKIVTGLAQHAGLYMRNGRKAAIAGIHTLEVTA